MVIHLDLDVLHVDYVQLQRFRDRCDVNVDRRHTCSVVIISNGKKYGLSVVICWLAQNTGLDV